jgi:hypothetical protein
MDLETKLLRKIIEAMDEYERGKRAEAARRCRLMEKLLKCTENQGTIKGTNDE